MNIFRKTLRTLAVTAIPAALALTATPAFAGPPPPNGTDIGGCSTSLTLPTPDAIACTGYYTGNILNGSPTDVLNQQNAIADLPGTFTWDGNWGNPGGLVAKGDVITSLSGPGNNRLDFGQTLFGTVIIGAHWGNIPETVPGDNKGNVSVFWLFNLTTPTNFITLDNTQGWSNAALYTTGTDTRLPEPGTWAMMLLGFGAAGVAVRRSRRSKMLVSQLA